MSYSQKNFKKIQLKVHGDFVEVFHCLKNLDEALSGLERKVNKRGFFVYNLGDLEKINKIFQINDIPEEEIFLSEDKTIVFNDKENKASADQNLIFYKFVNKNVILKFRYDKVIIDMLKMSKFRKWHNEAKLWEIGSTDFETLKQDFEHQGYQCIEKTSSHHTPQKRPLGEDQANIVNNAPSKARKVQGAERSHLKVPESLKRWPQSQLYKSMLAASSSEEEEDEIETILKTL